MTKKNEGLEEEVEEIQEEKIAATLTPQPPKEGEKPEEPGPVGDEEPPLAEGVETPFADLGIPELEGRTAEEVAHLYQLLKNTTVSQRDELDRKYEEVAEVESTHVTPDEYFGDPDKRVREIIREELDRTIAPFTRDQAKVMSEQVFDRFRAQYADFGELEPYVRQMIETNKGDPSSEGNVYWAYVAARGSRGLPGGPPTTTEGATTVSKPAATPPPQHSPSSQPLPDKEPKVRPLNENERRLAKEYGMSHDDYRALQKDDEMTLGRVGEEGEGE